MRITFVLPAPIRIPMGGAKVVYAHAHGLVARGHQVTVLAPRRPGGRVRDHAFGAAVALRNRLHGVPDAPYYEAEGVRTRVVPTPAAGHFPDADVVIATGWQTAPWVAALPPAKGAKAYFIQNKEDYLDARALDTWALPMARFACSRWLSDEIEAAGYASLGAVPNAVDPSEFYLETPPEARAPVVSFLYHRLPVKGAADALAVLGAVRQEREDVRVEVFAARPPSPRLPGWMSVHVRPSLVALRALYNRSAVFLHTSHREGWGLPPMEAAACGAAVVAAANEGVTEFLDPASAVLAPVGDTGALAEGVLALLNRPQDRARLAAAARERVAGYSWAASTAKLEDLLRRIV